MRRAPATSSIAVRALGQIAVRLAKPWIWLGWRRSATWHAGLAHPRRVGLALVAQRVEAGGDDKAGGRPERSGARRGEARGSSSSLPSGR